MASYGFGGSSSSSSLSPLAPPFMLDKPFNKLHSNPPTNFIDPSHGTGLEHQVSIWNPLMQDSSVANYMESGLGGLAYQPSADIYKKPDPQQENSSDTAHLLALNTLARAVYDEYSYEPYTNALSAPTAETDSYHPSYSLPTPASDPDLMTHNEHNYDLLTSFGSGSQGGYTSVDDTRSLSGVHYTPQWNGLWNGLSNTEQGKWLGIGGTFGSTGPKPSSDLSVPRSCANQAQGKWLDLAGNYGSNDHRRSSDASNSKSYVNPGQHAFGSSGPLAETPVSIKCSQDSSIARVPTMSSAGILNGKPDLHNPIQEYICKNESACGDLSDSHANYASYATPVMRSSPSAVTEVPLSDFTSTKCAFISSKGSARGNGVVEKPQSYSDYHFEYKDPYFTLGLGCPVADKAFTSHSLLPGSSSTKLETGLSKRSDPECGLTEFFKPQSLPEASQWRNPNNLNSKDDYSKILRAVEMPLDIPDGQNTSEDSPCWKGASSAHFSPFSDMKMASSGFEKGPLSTSVPVQVASGSTNPPTIEKPFKVSDFLAERDGSRATSPRLFSFGLCGMDGSRFSSKNNLKTAFGSKTSQVSDLTSEVKEDASRKKLMSLSMKDGLKDAQCGCASSSGSSSVSTFVDPNLASPPAVNEATSELYQSPGQELDAKLNIGMLVNAMKSMSELLSFHCSRHPAVTQELDNEALKQTISNLNSCQAKEIGPIKLVVQDDKVDHAQINKVPAVGMDCHDHDGYKISRSDIFQRKSKDDEMVQAIRRVLVEKLSCEDEMPENPQLYKNLWLEAEAALCAATTKARFNRMKKEMGESNSLGKDTLKSPLNSGFCTDMNNSGSHQSGIEKLDPPKTNEMENVECSAGFAEVDSLRKVMSFNAGRSSVIEVDNHETPGADITCTSRDMESSVISRFNILKSLCDVNSTKVGGSTVPGVEWQQCHRGPFVETPIGEFLDNSCKAESSVMSRFQILKARGDHLDSSKSDDDDDDDDDDEDDNGLPSPTFSDMACPIQDSYFSSYSIYGNENGVVTDDDPEGGVMARFSLLKRRNEDMDLMEKGEPQIDGSSSPRGLVEAGVNTTGSKDQVVGAPSGRVGGPLVEGWYDCSGSDWEHIVKEDFSRQN